MNDQDLNEAISFAHQLLFNYAPDIPQNKAILDMIITERLNQIQRIEISDFVLLPIQFDDQENINKITQIINQIPEVLDVWTPEIDQVLTDLKEKKEYTFAQISKLINKQFNRRYTPKQCQQHWARVVDPNITKGRWTPKEDKYLFHLIEDKNLTQQEAALVFPSRTGLQIWKRCKQLGLDVRK